MPRFSTLAAI
ncbi:hypothetical protein VCCP1050_1362, partial [Vibrio cholerae CP1050(23)]